MTRTLAIAAALAVALIGGAWWMSGQNSTPILDASLQANAQGADVDTSMVQEMTLGNPDAPVTVIEYASFTCPHCRNFNAGPYQQLKADYIDTGKINFVYREVYFDRYGLWAGMLARCDGGNKYFGIADMLYQQQNEWLASREPAGIAAALRKMGKTAGFDDATVKACLEDANMAQALVAVFQKNATADDINSTPSFVINGTKYNNMAYEEFQRILAEAGVE